MSDDLEELYRTRRPQFCRAARAIAGDSALGEDAVQDAFANAVRKRRSYRGRGSLEAWVWRIVINAARDARRSRRSLLDLRHRPEGSTLNGRRDALPLELLTDREREVLLSLAVYALAIRSRLPAEQTLEYVGDLAAEAEAEGAETRHVRRLTR